MAIIRYVFYLLFLLQTVYALPSVIVIGAGASGIATVNKLTSNGITNITLLEAEDRIGGRIYTVPLGAGKVDLGAEEIYGHTDNVAYDLVKDLNVLKLADYDHLQSYYSNHEVDEELIETLYNISKSIYDSDSNAPEGVKTGDYYIGQYDKYITELHLTDPKKIKFARNFIHLFHHIILSTVGSTSWFDTSARSSYVEDDAEFYNFNGKGFETVLKQLPISPIVPHLKKEVKKIVWNNNAKNPNGATVECADDSEYNADYVVFTPSLGVLKHDHKTLFEPKLPREKVHAIETLGIGPTMKIMMHFPSTWWPTTNFSGFHFIWTQEDKDGIENAYPEGTTKDGKSWLLDVFGFYRVEGVNDVLVVWITGETVPEIEKLDKKTIKDGLVYILKKFLEPKFHIPEPDEVKYFKWYTNPHFRGTFMYETIDSREGGAHTIQDLAKPLKNTNDKLTLLFAGSATCSKHYGTVNGAIRTGYREAKRIIASNEI